MRERIEQTCKPAELICTDKGRELMPLFEPLWTRAYLDELSMLSTIALCPNSYAVNELPSTIMFRSNSGGSSAHSP